MNIHFLYPLCLRCGFLSVRRSLFCIHCENEFLGPRFLNHVRWIEVENSQYAVDFLLHWIPQESDSLSELVYLLKNKLSASVWDYYVQQFIEKKEIKKHISTAIIPIPGSTLNKKAYHTLYFAKAWQKYHSGNIINCLINESLDGPQKKKTSLERTLIQPRFIEDFTTAIYEQERVILVDDIVTSGHTLQASLRALKPYLHKGCKVEIKALLSRSKI